MSRVVRFINIEAESSVVVARGGRVRDVEFVSRGTGLQLEKMRKCGDGWGDSSTFCLYSMSLNSTLNMVNTVHFVCVFYHN